MITFTTGTKKPLYWGFLKLLFADADLITLGTSKVLDFLTAPVMN